MGFPRVALWLPFGRVPELDATTLSDQLARDASPRLIDVRTPMEYRRDHIEGAENYPITRWPARWSDLEKQLRADPDRPIVAICLSAHRSIPAVRALRRAGFARSYQLAGGMRSWWRAGLPTTSAPSSPRR
jgi:rhodanese-related sulfurtransferase